MVEKVKQAGFQVVYTTSFVSLLLPLMLLSRRRRESGADMGKQMEAVGLSINRLTNAVLGTIMQIERKMINLGLSFRFGGSLLLVARKQIK